MKYLESKHERNSAKITALIVLILVLLCFVVGQDYKVEPEEYGVAINFGDASVVDNNVQPDTNASEEFQETESETEETEVEETLEEENIEEEVDAAAEALEAAEAAAEEAAAEEAAAEQEAAEAAAAEAKAAEEAAAAEKLLAQQEEEALKIKNEKEAKEAKERLEQLEKEAKEKAEKAAAAKKAAEAKAKADKEAKEANARAIAEAKKAEADRIAKAKAAKAAKAKADAEAAAKAAAAAAAKKKSEGAKEVSFALIENIPVYPGCEGGDNSAKKKCMNAKIKQFLGDKFDKSLASDLGLSGIQKMGIYFKINESGNIVGIKIKAPDPKLAEEAKRVVQLLPKMKPGMQQGKAVTVRYFLPLNVKGN